MKLKLRAMFALFMIFALAGGVYATYRYFNRGITFTVAVLSLESDEAYELSALSQWLTVEKRRFRFKLIASDKAKIEELLTSGKANMAVMRSDDVIPRKFSSISVVLKEAAIIATLPTSAIKTTKGLKGKTIGVIGDELLAQNLIKLSGIEGVKFVKITQDEAMESLASRKVHAIAFQTAVHGTHKNALLNMKQNLTLLSFDEAEDLAKRDKRYSDIDIAEKTLRQSPPLPLETISTLALSRHLVAAENLPNRVVSYLLHDLYDAKRALLRDNPLVSELQPPDVEPDASVKTHAGAVKYYNSDETSLSDVVTENIYLFPVLLGALGSFIIWLIHFLNPQKQHANATFLLDILEIKRQARITKNVDALQSLKEQLEVLFNMLKDKIENSNISDDTAFTLISTIEETSIVLEKRIKKTKPAARVVHSAPSLAP